MTRNGVDVHAAKPGSTPVRMERTDRADEESGLQGADGVLDLGRRAQQANLHHAALPDIASTRGLRPLVVVHAES